MAAFMARSLKNGDAGIPTAGTINHVAYDCVNGPSYFGDVAVGSLLCKHIHYIGSVTPPITLGCIPSPPKYCPADPVPETQMMAFMQRGWANYHPVPRGTYYTFRDEANRVLTESMDNVNGPTAATLVKTRDNIFLGSLLVGTYVSSTIGGGNSGWTFFHSDHLGTPRHLSNLGGGTGESGNPKYWPYGDEVTVNNTSPKLRFATMERDSENNHYYDHARPHDFNLGRFVSVDKVGGRPRDPQSWNRYAYARNNPLRLVDSNGLWWSVATTDSQYAYFRNALIQNVMRPTFRADFYTVAASSREFRMSSGSLGINEARVVSDILNHRDPNVNFAAGTGIGGGGFAVTFDVKAIKDLAHFTLNLSPGAIDAEGRTTVGHETFHFLDKTNSGDSPTSGTGPAQRYGEKVFNERADISETAARSIVGQKLNSQPSTCTGEGAACAE